MHWLLWVAGGLVVLYLAGRFIVAPWLGKEVIGGAYRNASPQKQAEMKKAIRASNQKDPNVGRLFTEWTGDTLYANSLFASGSNRLSI